MRDPQNDTKKLAEAKQLVYLKGFTDGVLVVGDHAGKKVRGQAGRCGAVFSQHMDYCSLTVSSLDSQWPYFAQVSEVKSVIKNEMIEAGDALLYSGMLRAQACWCLPWPCRARSLACCANRRLFFHLQSQRSRS